MMKKIIFPILMICALIFITKPPCFASSGKAYVKWLISTFGTLDEKEEPRVSEVRDIFDRVLTAADKRMNRLPKLLILKGAGDPWAMCWKDGTIILTEQAMKFCYQNVDKKIGDARIAFIMGHELAHLANDDFWDLEVSEAIQKVASDSKAFQQINAIFAKSEKDARERQKKELKADGYGLLYAAMAGYLPKEIVNTEGKNFFREWTNLTTGKIAYANNTHPAPDQRATFLLSEMEEIKKHLILFDIGVRLCQLGMYKDALGFLETFQNEFPCREVFNNIGLIHYQTAIKGLAEIRPEKAYRYRLATVLDTETRAGTFRGTEDIFKEALWKAKKNFEYACEQDGFYLPALINLSSALIMEKDYPGASKVLDKALKLSQNNPKILNNRAVAEYLLGVEFKADKSEESIRILKELTEKYPGYADPFFNLGRILSEQGKDSKAKTIWQKYISLEPRGRWAENAEKASGIETGLVQVSDLNQPKRLGTFKSPPPVPPGASDETAQKILAGIPAQSFELENVAGEYYMGEAFQVLVLEGEITFVQSPIRQKTDYDEIISIYGVPIRISEGPAGINTLVYDTFALDVKDKKVITVIHFQ